MSLRSAPVAIVLAAGRSDRLPNKLLEDVGGRPMVERTVRVFLKARKVNDVVLVVARGERERFDWLRSVRVHLLENAHPSHGMIESIRTGLRSPWTQEKDFLLHPADVPYVKSELVDHVVDEFSARACRILLPAYRGLGGHPGLYADAIRQDFFLHGDRSGAREILLRHRDATLRLAVHDPDVCFDVDTPDDLRCASDPGARWARVEAKVEAKRAGRAAD